MCVCACVRAYVCMSVCMYAHVCDVYVVFKSSVNHHHFFNSGH